MGLKCRSDRKLSLPILMNQDQGSSTLNTNEVLLQTCLDGRRTNRNLRVVVSQASVVSRWAVPRPNAVILYLPLSAVLQLSLTPNVVALLQLPHVLAPRGYSGPAFRP